MAEADIEKGHRSDEDSSHHHHTRELAEKKAKLHSEERRDKERARDAKVTADGVQPKRSDESSEHDDLCGEKHKVKKVVAVGLSGHARLGVGALALYLLVGLAIYMPVEGWGPLKTLFYSVQVMTTVGWGETSPVTVTGKVLTVFYILEGLTLLVSLLGTVFEYAMEKAQRAGETTKDKLQDLTEATLGNDAVDTPRVYANAVTEFFKCNWLKLSPRVRAFIKARCILWAVIGFGTALYGTLPGEMGYVDAMYMTTVSMATVGFGDYLPTTRVGEIVGLFWLPASTVLAGYALTMPISVHISEKEAALKDKILSEELEFEELLKADDDGDGDVSQSEYILYKLEQMGLVEQVIIDKLIADWYELQEQNATDIETVKERHLSRNSASLQQPADQQQQQQGSPQQRKSQSQQRRQSQQQQRQSQQRKRKGSGSPPKPAKGEIEEQKAEIDENKDSSIDYHKH